MTTTNTATTNISAALEHTPDQSTDLGARFRAMLAVWMPLTDEGRAEVRRRRAALLPQSR